MNTASREWEAQVAARNEIEVAKATRLVQGQFLWSCGNKQTDDGKGVPLSAAGKEGEE